MQGSGGQAQHGNFNEASRPSARLRIATAPSAMAPQGRLLVAVAAWVAAMGHWLFWAYQLEFGGRPLYLAVWGASLAFFAAHVWVIVELVLAGRRSGGGGPAGPARKEE